MKALMPSHAKKVQEYHDEKKPLFQRYNLDSQLFDIFSPKVTLNSGGYLIIDQTEALVAIDVNSGKATRERSIEDTALKTNLEAAEEFARQARLRDLSGLVVIDFIDMEEIKNRNSVEKKLKEAMRKDRARIQIGQISGFGLLELSRQRLRPSVVENSSELCSHCGGSGRIQSIEVSAVQILRSIEEEGADDNNIGINVYAHSNVILHILNKKRDQLSEIQSRYNILIEFINDNSIIPPLKKLETVQKINTQNKIQKEKKENQEGSAINDEENNNRRKRGKKIGRRNKKLTPNKDLSNEEETKNNNQNIKSETKATDKTDQKEISKNIKKRKKAPENNKHSNESNSKKNKSVKIKSDNDNILDDEKNNLNESTTTETKNPRIVQTSSPIEVTEIDNDTKPQKPKRKGWWSK
jgi:ribonuclease E